MRKKIVVVGAVVLVLVFLQVGISRARGMYGRRQHNQVERIAQGVRCGEVSRREYQYLDNERRRIQRSRRHFLADGWISRGERRHLNSMQERASHDIYRARHCRRGCGCSSCSGHVVRRYDRRRFSCSDRRRYRIALDDPAWGFSGFFYDRW